MSERNKITLNDANGGGWFAEWKEKKKWDEDLTTDIRRRYRSQSPVGWLTFVPICR